MKSIIIFLLYLLFRIAWAAERSKMVVVTAYYPLPKSKHSQPEYKKWIKNFFESVHTETFIFTSPGILDTMMDILNSSSNENKNSTLIISKNSDIQQIKSSYVSAKPFFTFMTFAEQPYDLPCMQDLRSSIEKQHELDPEKFIHSQGLYYIWTSKPWMVQYVSELDLFSEAFYFWVDIGTQRNSVMVSESWPRYQLINRLLVSVEKIILTIISKNSIMEKYKKMNDDAFNYGKNRGDFVIGGYFGCKKSSCALLSRLFYDKQKLWIKANRFAGKEQNILDAIVIDNPDLFTAFYWPIIGKNLKESYLEAFWKFFDFNSTIGDNYLQNPSFYGPIANFL